MAETRAETFSTYTNVFTNDDYTVYEVHASNKLLSVVEWCKVPASYLCSVFATFFAAVSFVGRLEYDNTPATCKFEGEHFVHEEIHTITSDGLDVLHFVGARFSNPVEQELEPNKENVRKGNQVFAKNTEA